MSHTPFTARRMVKILLFGLIGLIFVGYILYQSRLFITGPVVELTNEPTTVQTERFLVLTGIAKNITAISINGRPIQTTADGVFEERIILENGYTIVRVNAEDRYGRTTSLERTFVYIEDEQLAP